MGILLRHPHDDDIDRLGAVDGGPAWKADRAKWTRYLSEQQAGQRVVLLTISNGEPVGYGSLLWDARHRPFRDAKTPEISDLVVAAGARRHGIASAMIERFEGAARAAGRKASVWVSACTQTMGLRRSSIYVSDIVRMVAALPTPTGP
jgi:GNAT superfamily N-acetyltransferase